MAAAPDRLPVGPAFHVGPYRCIPLAEPLSAAPEHIPAAVVRRQGSNHLHEARLTFAEETFATPEEAVAYAAARTDFLLRFEAASVVPF